jgi:hypothetical protein
VDLISISDGTDRASLQSKRDDQMNGRLVFRSRLVALIFASTARTSLSLSDALVVKRQRILFLSWKGNKLSIGMRRTSHAYLFQKPYLCQFVIVSAARRYRILHMSGADSHEYK